LFLGSLFHTIKGGFDSVKLRQKLRESKDWLTRDALSSLKPYQRFLAQQRLLLTEYLIRCSQLRAKGASLSDLIALKERMNLKMDELIQKAQQELESRPANKLDVAQLVSGIRQLSIAVDKDLNNCQKDINDLRQAMNNLQKALSNLKKELTDIKQNTDHLKAAQRRQDGSIKALENDLKSISERIAAEAKKMGALMKKRLGLIWGFNILLILGAVIIIWNVFR